MPTRFAGLKGDECQCGRRSSVRHCTECGSSRIYGYARPDRFTKLNGETVLVEHIYRCLACSHRFIDEEREFCNAPPYTAALARLKAQRLHSASLNEKNQSNQYLDPRVIATAIGQSAETKREEATAIAVQDIANAEQVTPTTHLCNDAKQKKDEFDIDPSTIMNGLPTEDNQEILSTLRREKQSNEARLPITGELLMRKEWAELRLKGVQLPSVNEYISRRLKGEVFDK